MEKTVNHEAQVADLEDRIRKLKRFCRHDSDCPFLVDGKVCRCGLFELLGIEL